MLLRKTPPPFEMHDPANIVLPYTKPTSYLCLRKHSDCRQLADTANFGSRQFSHWVFAVDWVVKPTFVRGVLRIIFASAGKQVRGIAAASYITAMTNAGAQWYWTIGKFVGNAMGRCVLAANFVFAVTCRGDNGTKPQPAGVSVQDFDSSPKPFRKGRFVVPTDLGTKHTGLDVTFMGAHGVS